MIRGIILGGLDGVTERRRSEDRDGGERSKKRTNH